MTRADRILVLVVALGVLVSAPIAFAGWRSHATAAVVTGPGGRSEIDLSRDGIYEVAGLRGTVKLTAAGGQIECVDADCPDGICVRTGVARAGRPIVCAPNGVSVTLKTSGEGELDALNR